MKSLPQWFPPSDRSNLHRLAKIWPPIAEECDRIVPRLQGRCRSFEDRPCCQPLQRPTGQPLPRYWLSFGQNLRFISLNSLPLQLAQPGRDSEASTLLSFNTTRPNAVGWCTGTVGCCPACQPVWNFLLTLHTLPPVTVDRLY